MAARRPLPVAAFHVMVHDRPDRLAISAPVEFNYSWDHHEEISNTRAQVNGRCQDLLSVVKSQPRPGDRQQLYRLEFLHRSVRDFLNESEAVRTSLNKYAGQDSFDVHLTLLSCYVFLVKRALNATFDQGGTRTSHRTSRALRHEAQGWCAEAFFHLRNVPPRPSSANLVTALDNSMKLTHADLGQCHWSNHLVEDPKSYGEPAKLHDLDVTERGHRDLLGHLIEHGLVDHVAYFLKTDSTALEPKKGRPYLDYALRYKTGASARPKPQEELESARAMVELLLDNHLDVNERVYIHGGRTVWDSYVFFIYDNDLGDDHHRQITRLLIEHGARSIDKRVQKSTDQHGPGTNAHDSVVEVQLNHMACISMENMLKGLFGEEEAKRMVERVRENSQDQCWWPRFSWRQAKDIVILATKDFAWNDRVVPVTQQTRAGDSLPMNMRLSTRLALGG